MVRIEEVKAPRQAEVVLLDERGSVRTEKGQDDEGNGSDPPSITSNAELSRRALLKSGAGAGLGLAGFQRASRASVTAAQAGEKTITMGMWQPIPTLNTLMTAETGNVVSGSRLVLRGLLFFDEESNPIGDLATEVPTLENGGVSSDGQTITFKLRPGVTWHDGEPVTAEDVKFTWETIMNPDSGVVSRYGYDVIQAIDTPDEGTVVVQFQTIPLRPGKPCSTSSCRSTCWRTKPICRTRSSTSFRSALGRSRSARTYRATTCRSRRSMVTGKAGRRSTACSSASSGTRRRCCKR